MGNKKTGNSLRTRSEIDRVGGLAGELGNGHGGVQSADDDLLGKGPHVGSKAGLKELLGRGALELLGLLEKGLLRLQDGGEERDGKVVEGSHDCGFCVKDETLCCRVYRVSWCMSLMMREKRRGMGSQRRRGPLRYIDQTAE